MSNFALVVIFSAIGEEKPGKKFYYFEEVRGEDMKIMDALQEILSRIGPHDVVVPFEAKICDLNADKW